LPNNLEPWLFPSLRRLRYQQPGTAGFLAGASVTVALKATRHFARAFSTFPAIVGHRSLVASVRNGQSARPLSLYTTPVQTMGDAHVRQASFHKLIRRALRDHFAAVMAEPIPQRWVDLLNRLAEQEPNPRQAPAKRDRELGHPIS
jgi:hypothetical protein